MSKYKERYKYYAINLALTAIMYGVLGPLEIYAGNQGEFIFGTNSFIWMFIVVCIFAVICGAFILCILPEKVSEVLSAGIFYINVMSYVQNMFLNRNLMNLDGSSIDWSKQNKEIILNLLIWLIISIAIITFCIISKDIAKKVIVYVTSFLILIQLIASLSIVFTVQYDTGMDDKYSLTAEKQYTLGKTDNVILIILDKYGNGRFEDMLAEDSSLTSCLKDFTYFDNMNSRYAYTDPSIVYTLTLYDDIDKHLEESDVKSQAWRSDRCVNMYKDIHDAGYLTYIYTGDITYIYKNAECILGTIDNASKVRVQLDSGLLFRLLTKMSIYKYVPTIIKPYFETSTSNFRGVLAYLDGREPDFDNYAYYSELSKNGLSIDDKTDKMFVVQHLWGMHEPFTIDAEGKYVDNLESEEALVEAQKGVMLMLNTYINELKKEGLYDSSTIIITSDHGFKYEKYDPQPILFVKPAYHTQDKMDINSAPVTSEDIMPTVLSAMGIDYKQYGTTIYDWKEDDHRLRYTSYPEIMYKPFAYDGDKEILIDMMKQQPILYDYK